MRVSRESKTSQARGYVLNLAKWGRRAEGLWDGISAPGNGCDVMVDILKTRRRAVRRVNIF
jgi:hypothetical protein